MVEVQQCYVSLKKKQINTFTIFGCITEEKKKTLIHFSGCLVHWLFSKLEDFEAEPNKRANSNSKN